MRKRLGTEDRFVITHIGALGGLYLSKELADFIATARAENPKTYALFLTQTDPERIVPLLRERGFGNEDYFVGKVRPNEVADYLRASDLSLSFVRATFATQSRSPTKIPEYLAAGLPIVANTGVGDVDELIQKNQVGVLVSDFSEEEYLRALAQIRSLNGIGDHCHEIATREFDLESVGGERYGRIYARLMQ
jgi:glycosyltransferase involved in cell wall biosynthesis